MSAPARPAWLGQLATALRVVADGLDGGNSAVAASKQPDQLLLGLTALVRIAGPVQRIVQGRGDLQDDVQVANSVMDAVALAFPSTAALIAEIEMAEGAFLWLAGLVRDGKITGGMPPSYPPGGGPGVSRGR